MIKKQEQNGSILYIIIISVGILVLLVILRNIALRRSQNTPSQSFVNLPVSSQPSQGNQPAACQVKSLQQIGQGRVEDWSQQTGLLLTNPKDGNTYQIHTRNLDGSNDTCLTCSPHPGAPSVDRFKIAPRWTPSGEWIALVGEVDNDPLRSVATLGTTELQKKLQEAAQINGWYSNVYVTTPDGSKWYNLTNNTPDQGLFGYLGPNLSNDGKKIFLPSLVGKPDKSHPYGFWRLKIADFIVDANGVPSLQNIQDITPGNGAMYEPFGFSPDNSKIIMTSDMTTTASGFDIYLYDLSTKQVTNLTNTPDQWDEHAKYSPNGQKITWMSSSPYASSGPAEQFSLKTELMLMNADGSGKTQLTHFNTPGYPEYSQERSIAGRSLWSADGSQVVFNRLWGGTHYPEVDYWLLSFNGKCG